MTANAIAYLKYQEDRRTNQANEAIKAQHNAEDIRVRDAANRINEANYQAQDLDRDASRVIEQQKVDTEKYKVQAAIDQKASELFQNDRKLDLDTQKFEFDQEKFNHTKYVDERDLDLKTWDQAVKTGTAVGNLIYGKQGYAGQMNNLLGVGAKYIDALVPG